MAISFFVAWELWEQLTFVLAGAIVLVFLAGLVKLWWMQRFLKKHTKLDEEKQVRQQEMRKSGLPVGRRVDIPFGVRAIQSGVEVDGIWISRPGTPVELDSPGASPTTLGPDSGFKGKEKVRVRSTLAAADVQTTPKQSPQPSPVRSLFERSSTEPEPDSRRAPPLGPPSTYRPKHSSRRTSNLSSSDVLTTDAPGQQERTGRPLVETYVPTTSFSSVYSSASSHNRTTVERSSSSSDEGFGHATPRYTPNTRTRPVVPPPGQRSPLEDPERSPQGECFSGTHAESRRNPHEAHQTNRASGQYPQASSRQPLATNRPTPVRTYTGDSHANTSSRRVNPGFEVLPAGTFSRSNSDADMESGQPSTNNTNRFSVGANNRLQRKGRDRSSSRDPAQ
ncbi:Uu.00g014450.m01.CDS01 [Anthostomella pinea]|uniref:Uu.00g014450.m01.CDS01 n=1 Tax=Anthostomella pinea TaxID=933095 RepID=A0AAI8YQF4_9PEZI|nr:Uu.00g014450.m01.CDS01 [Anthostomella pinea]